MISRRKVDLDKVGAIASAVCAVHCLLTGVAIGLLSVMGLGFFGSIWTDAAFIGVAMVVGVMAVRHGLKKHHSAIPARIFLASLIFIVLGHFVYREGTAFSTLFSVLGGLSLVTFHVVNLRLGHSCKHECTCGPDHLAESQMAFLAEPGASEQSHSVA